MLHVTVEKSGDAAILRCVGRLVRGHETTLLCPAARQRRPNVVLDLSEVDAIDAAGIGALVSLQAAGIYVELLNPSKPVREMLQVTRLDTVFEVLNSPPIPNPDHTASQGYPGELSLSPAMSGITLSGNLV